MINPILKTKRNFRALFSILVKRGLVLLLLSVTIHSTFLQAQCFPTTYQNGNDFSTINPGGLLNFNFVNAPSVAASDGSYASASSITSLLVGDTYYLKVTDFKFNIPPYASICGITVQIDHRAAGLGLGSIRDNDIRLIKRGVIAGSNMASSSNWSGGASFTTATYGSTTDMAGTWNVPLTPADVDTTDFGIAISVHVGGIIVIPTAQIDNIRISVVFNPILPVTLQYFNASNSKSLVNLQWKTTEEEDNSSIELQRTSDNNKWETISHFTLHRSSTGKFYQYQDRLTAPGAYNYRLKITASSGMITYSAIKNIRWSGTGDLALYPNPSADFVYIDNMDPDDLIIANTSLQRFKLPLEKTGDNTWRMDLHSLPAGIYFVRTAGRTLNFLKQ